MKMRLGDKRRKRLARKLVREANLSSRVREIRRQLKAGTYPLDENLSTLTEALLIASAQPKTLRVHHP